MPTRKLPVQIQRPESQHSAVRADPGLSATTAADHDHCADSRSPGRPHRDAFVAACRRAAFLHTIRSLRSGPFTLDAFRRAAVKSGGLPALPLWER